MAIEETILLGSELGSSPNTLRFWTNSRSAIIGISQNPIKEIDLEACSKYHVAIVKRFTGGGTVYNDLGNLNWTIVINKNSLPKDIEGVLEIYKKMSQSMILALKNLDIKANFISPNSIFLFNKKISGLAMYVKSKSILCHGTLLIDSDLNILDSVLKNLKNPVTNINDNIDIKVSKNEIINELIKTLSKTYNIKLLLGKRTIEEKKIIKKLDLKKYKPNIRF